MTRRATMLVATWDGAGNFPPIRALVRALVERGHDVSVMTHDVKRAEVAADGARFEPYATAPQIDSAGPGVDEALFEKIVGAPQIGADVTTAIARIRPDVVLVDAMLATGLEAALASGAPTVALGHSLLSLFDLPPFQPLKALNARAALMLQFSYRAFEPDVQPPANVAYVGPLRPQTSAEPWPRKLRGKPLVVASLSTSHQGQDTLLQRLSDALGELDVEGLVTTGRGFAPESLRAPPTVTVARHVAHEAVLGQTDLLITHAGHGTVMAGTSWGAPMLCLPMGRDQSFVAARAAEAGIARVASCDASVAELKTEIETLLADETVRTRARAFARTVAGQADAARAAERVEALIPAAAALCAG